ncbi:MAG: glycosyltransferase family 2 protein [Cyanobacteriota bacterium]
MTDPFPMASDAVPRVSVVVMSFNRPQALERCLASLAAQTLAKEQFEVVLVDVSDPPNHPQVARYGERLRLRHRSETNRGVAGNRNLGAAAASAPLLAVLDDDCVAHPEWLATLLAAAARHPGALIGGGVTNLLPGNPVASAGQLIQEAVDRHFNPDPNDARFVAGLNFAVPTERFRQMGGNDEGYGRRAAEDREFCSRWRAEGGRIVKAEMALVAHEHRADLPGFLRQYYNYGRGAWIYHRTKPAVNTRGEPTGGTHLGLLKQLGRELAASPRQQRPQLALLLLGWEAANLAGFVREALGGSQKLGEGR